jgi:hypothetical protein
VAGVPFLLIGNPDNRRVTLFEEALLEKGAPFRVFAHDTLLEDASSLARLPDEPAFVRLDSPGESLSVARKLLALGQKDAVAAGVEVATAEELSRRALLFGEVRAPTQQHLGFARYLERLEEVCAAHPAWHVLQRPSEVAAAFDKRATHARLRAASVPVAPALDEVDTPDALVEAMRARDVARVFVKHRYGSSASCLAAYSNEPDAPEYLLTSLKREGDRRFNSLKLQRRDGEAAREVLAYLLREGAHVEEQRPKAKLDGAYFDLRVLVVAERPVVTLVRQSRHPITNLHLGGWRGDVSALVDSFGPALLNAAHDVAVRAAACFSLFSAGVDVLVEPDGETCRVLEVNAFGDLLPGTGAYEAQIDAALVLAGEV